MKVSLFSTAVLAAACSLSAFGQTFSGAIYTSTQNGTSVNQNLYDQLTDVYLNGGPQNTSGAGLPNGRYYFQVVNPSTSDLLSTDLAVCRQVEVIGGYVAGISLASVSAGCAHVNGIANPTTGALPVQLSPYTQTTNNGGVYKLELWQQNCSGGILSISADGTRVLGPANCNKTDNFKVKIPNGGCDGLCDPTDLAGYKYYDANANGAYDGPPTEMGLSDFHFTLDGGSTVTSVDGNFGFSGLQTGTSYLVCEVKPTGTGTGPTDSYWAQTQPANNGCYTAKPGDGTLLFGNICLQKATGGYTLGFWSNKNGQTAWNGYAAALADMVALNLRNPNGSNFDPANYAAFKNWLLNGNAVNMAYMLSVQLSATYLDTRVSVGGKVLDRNTTVLTAYWGPRTIESLIQEANTALYSGGALVVDAGAKSPQRQYFENLKTTLDDINNNRLPFVLGNGACQATY